MGEVEQFDRKDLSAGEEYRSGWSRNGKSREDSARLEVTRPDASFLDSSRKDPNRLDPARPEADRLDGNPVPNGREPLPRPLGSPLPVGAPGKSSLATASGDSPVRSNVPPPGRALSTPSPVETETTSGMQWALGIMKQAVPFIQKLLPLIDGQIATAAANLLATRPHTPPPSSPPVDLQPIERSLSELQINQRGLIEQLVDQNTSLKRVDDQLEMVREATDRNTLEQQELIEDLKTMSNRVNLLALLFLGLLAVSVLLNIFLFLHIQRVLP
jgi:hypothetical protein